MPADPASSPGGLHTQPGLDGVWWPGLGFSQNKGPVEMGRCAQVGRKLIHPESTNTRMVTMNWADLFRKDRTRRSGKDQLPRS